MKTKKLPVGVSDFKDIVSGDYCYVDKTLFIKEIMDKGDKILLVPRPRRFGKTLNLSMLRHFYDCCPGQTGIETHPPNMQDSDLRKIFESLKIGKAGSEYMDKLGQHPVIFFSFRAIKELSWEVTLSKIKDLIRNEYLKHDYLLHSPALKPYEKNYFSNIINSKGNLGEFEQSLEKLLIFLNRFYKKRVVILIDEYDSPVHAGYTNNYYNEIINFIRNFLSGGLKDTDQYLEKSVITGIMRIAKESVFSGLNNPGVYTLLSEEFDEQFGFTEQEVESLLKDFQLLDRYGDVRKWYNGYKFGARVVYNPWSIINFLGSKTKELKPYWINTSDNRIVDSLLSRGGTELKQEIEQLVRGEEIEKAIEENIILKEITVREELLWSFLLMGGYLKQTAKQRHELTGKMYYKLSIPNLEVKSVYVQIIDHYFATKIEKSKLEIMLKALVEGEIDVFEEIFSEFVVTSMSFIDPGNDPEKVYHAFVMGLLLWLSPDFEVKSNRESGYGRYDIMIIPRDVSKLGFVVEFKKVRKKETVETALESALNQINERKYETELIQRGIKNIKKLAIAFHGKEVTVKEG